MLQSLDSIPNSGFWLQILPNAEMGSRGGNKVGRKGMGSSHWVLATQVGNLDYVPHSWPGPAPIPAIENTYR